MKLMGWIAVLVVAMVGCGDDGAPVDGDTRVIELSSGEREDLCRYWIDQLGPRRTITCPDGEASVGGDAEDVADCIDDLGQLAEEAVATCPLTVDQLDACIEAQAAQSDDEACGGDPVECEALEDVFDDCAPPDDGV